MKTTSDQKAEIIMTEETIFNVKIRHFKEESVGNQNSNILGKKNDMNLKKTTVYMKTTAI